MSFVVDVAAATLRTGTPLALGATGEVVCERAGVLNLGIEGTMYAGAFFGFLTAYQTGSVWWGLPVAIAVGAAAGWLLSWFVVTLGVSQHTAGLGLTLGLIGLSDFINRLVVSGNSSSLAKVRPFGQWDPFGASTGDGGPGGVGVLFEQYWLTYAAFLVIVPAIAVLLKRTSFGLAITAVGENPEAAEVAGIDVARVRRRALMLGGALMGLAGSFLTLFVLGTFTLEIIAGRGWVCLALVIFGRWRTWPAVLGGLLFATVSALQFRLRILKGWEDVPFELLLALPFLVTIAALALSGRSARYPGAYLKPHRRT